MDGIDLEVWMNFYWIEYSQEIEEFLSVETLEKIDYGILDLSNVRDLKLREVLHFFEELLTLELKVNYLDNSTGIFRVDISGGRYCYREFGYVIEADSIPDLRERVILEGRIWYVFDDVLACEIMWCKSIFHSLFLGDFYRIGVFNLKLDYLEFV